MSPSPERLVTLAERTVLDMLPHRTSAQHLAQLTNTSLAELKLAFLVVRGASLYSALLKLRLMEADRLIRSNPRLTPEAAAQLCGFGHYGVFHREFRAAFGREPDAPAAAGE